MVEPCSANAETTGSNPVEAPKSSFFWGGGGGGWGANFVKCDRTAVITSSFHLYFRSSQFTLFYVQQSVNKPRTSHKLTEKAILFLFYKGTF